MMESVQVTGELTGDQLIISVKAEKESPEEDSALLAMEEFAGKLKSAGIQHETFYRNTRHGDRVDQVRISL